ncbi:MAG: class I SAM-dependent methyltransferase [Calditrichaeota bacterium]|nr:class I SAM-dependent methyltransferase [Calditrichota bacterium]HQU70878.1 class I SAM-dependent methyltransferase [Calditrichia bacterium]
MIFNDLKSILSDIPNTPPEDGQVLYDFILNSATEDILELGFNHGVSTCYMAGALQEKGVGKVITIDRHAARKVSPSLEALLAETGLSDFVEPRYVTNSYTWELRAIIARQSEQGSTVPCFDFCFLDGAHTWETDGMAFFLVDKLLRPGGWILFDDLDWSFASSHSLKNTRAVKAMPEDERTLPQMQEVFDLLVAQHPGYQALRRDQRWGWAQKKPAGAIRPPADVDLLQATYDAQSILPEVKTILRKLRSRFRG